VGIADFWHTLLSQTEFRPVSSTPTRQRKYVTWRLPDRHFSKVHLVGEPGSTVCGRALPRATGQPKAPIPESEMCPDCDAQG
jgi:hypothetical protein